MACVDEPRGFDKEFKPAEERISKYADIDKMMTYQPPKPGQSEKYLAIREKAKELIITIVENSPACADQSAAIRKVREAVMTANAAIALDGLV